MSANTSYHNPACGTALCRPSEAVLPLLPVPKLAPFAKEDDECSEDSGVRRV
ncbi:MAG: hypothetical protein KGI67_06780 [Pseudomonadota bacterium]|nr:hypothetical protein [Pseudomonadota bacterium]